MQRDIEKGIRYEYIHRLTNTYQPETGVDSETFSSAFFSKNSLYNDQNAAILFRAAFEDFLGATSDNIKDYLTIDYVEDLKLTPILDYISFPPGLDKKKDLWYIACLMYPRKYPYDDDKHTIAIYEKVLKDELKRFPKNFFEDYVGRRRATVCLRHMIEKYESFDSIREMYAFFASNEGTKELSKYELKLVWKHVFSSPVAYLHASLGTKQRNEFYSHYYEYQYRFRTEARDIKKKQKYIEKSIEDKRAEDFFKHYNDFINIYNEKFEKIA